LPFPRHGKYPQETNVCQVYRSWGTRLKTEPPRRGAVIFRFNITGTGTWATILLPSVPASTRPSLLFSFFRIHLNLTATVCAGS
jgi:hypothetical protein